MSEPLDPNAPFLVEMWPVDRPTDYPANPRKYSEADVDEMVEVLREFGWRQPIVVDDAGVIVIGHRRRRAARRLGMNVIPVHVCTGLEAEKIRALRLVDNKVHKGGAAWAREGLRAELLALVGNAPLPGFRPLELERLLGEKKAVPLPEYPIVPKMHEHYSYLVILVDNETDHLWLRQFLEVGTMRSYKSDSHVGVGHVITCQQFAATMKKRGALP